MATVKYGYTNYGVIELTHVASRKTGQIEAQTPLNSTDFATVPAENGMLLVVNRADKSVDLPGGPTVGGLYLHYSEEKSYDPANLGLDKFSLLYSATLYPRMYALVPGDTFITSCVAFDTTTTATEAAWDIVLAAYATTDVFGVPDATGRIMLTQEAGTVAAAKTLLRVIDVTTLPNGNWALEFEVQKNNKA